MKKTSRVLLAATILGAALVATVTHQLGGRPWDLDLGASRTASAETYDLRSLKVLARTALYIQGNYLDQEKVEPRKMLASALDKVEWLLPEVVVAPAPGESEENPAALRITVGKSSSLFDIGAVDTLWSMREKLKEMIGYIQDHQQNPDVKPQDIEYAAINGVLSTLDPHSVLLDPDMYQEMKVGTHGEFGGLGIVISIRDHELTVVSPLEDTPAYRAGLKAGDNIVQIEDESTINMRLDDAVELLRGKVNSQVTIWVKRKGWAEPRKYTLVREKITIKSVTSKLLDRGVGYVKLKSFQAHSQEQVKEHLDRMRQQNGGELKGVVLDMRGNPGGLLEQAIKISDLWLDSGTIVLTVGKGNTVKEEHKASWSGTEKGYPMVVLVGPGSASASEIVAGALQNNDRAVVVGSQTFGKGSVQVLYDMDDGSALKLTIAQYLTPGEVSIQGVGIMPDIELDPVTIEKKAIHYYAEDRFGEGDLDAHLTNDAAVQKKRPGAVVRYYEEPTPELKPGEEPPPPPDDDKVDEDFAVRFAQGLLLQAKSSRRPELIQQSRGWIAGQHDAEVQKIAGGLSKLGIDWGAGANPAGVRPVLTLSSDKTDNRVTAGETIILRGRVRNSGNTPLYRLRGLTRSDNDQMNGLEFTFGKLMPGQERTWEVPLEIGKQEETRTDIVHVSLYSGDGTEELGQGRMLVAVEAQKRPHFAYSYQLVDDKGGNGDGAVQRGEKMDMRLFITNLGPGKAQDISATLTNQSGENVFLEQGRQKIPALAPGERSEVTFRFQVKPKLNEEKVKLQVDILDMAQREGLEENLELPVVADAPRVKPVAGALVASNDLELRVGASDKMPLVARVRSGRTLAALSGNGKWYGVDLGGGRRGWVEARLVQFKDPKASAGLAKLQPKDLQPYIERVSPTVRFDAATTALKVTDRPRVRITGEALDDQRVQDLYLFTTYRNGKLTKSRKLSFLTNEDPRSPGKLGFSLDVELQDGVNTIAVVARDNDKLTTMQRINVLRLPTVYSEAQR